MFTAMRRLNLSTLTMLLLTSPAVGQERPLAPIERLYIGGDRVLEPLGNELPRHCSCVDTAFALPRMLNPDGARRGTPIRPTPARRERVRRRLDREWKEELSGGQAFDPNANMHDRFAVAQFLVTGRGVGDLQGSAAVAAGIALYR